MGSSPTGPTPTLSGDPVERAFAASGRFGTPAGAVVAERLVAPLQRLGQAPAIGALTADGPVDAGIAEEGPERGLVHSQRAQLGARADRGAQTHHVHRPVHGPLVQLGDVGRHQRDALGHRQHLVIQAVRREHPVGPAEADRVLARDPVAGQHHLHGGPRPQEPGVELHVGHPEAHRRVPDAGVVGHVDQVAAGGQLAAAGQTPPVDLGDDRLGQVPDAHPRVGHVTGPEALASRGEVGEVVALVAVAELVAGAEAAPRAADDRHADLGVLIRLAQRVENPSTHGVVERVALVGPVQRDAADPLGGRVDEHGVGH